MTPKRLGPRQLAGKIIDAHTHVGLALASYLAGSFPYCQDVESLLCRMDSHGVDAAVCFPMWESVFFDAQEFVSHRRRRPAQPTVSAAPYVLENRLLCEEVYEKVPTAARRLLPFACIDPARRVKTQLRELERLSEQYPLYGLKLSGVMIQSSHAHLLARGEGFVRFARERNIPILLHTTAYTGDRFCHNSINLRIARTFPAVRFCMAHCMGFDKTCLDEADAMGNVFVDSAAMKIQIEAPPELLAPPERRFSSDYSDYRRVFADLAAAYGRSLLWGSDSPAYSYFEKRRYADGSTVNFCLRGTYAQEKSALDALRNLRLVVANRNTCRFLFGPGKA